MLKLLLLLVAFDAVDSAVMRLPVALGSREVLFVGPEVKVLKRRTEDGVQTIEACELGDRRSECSQWRNEDGKFVTGVSPARLLPSGQLILEKLTKRDLGGYSNAAEPVVARPPALTRSRSSGGSYVRANTMTILVEK